MITAAFTDNSDDQTRVALAQDQSPDLTHVRLVKAGETLPKPLQRDLRRSAALPRRGARPTASTISATSPPARGSSFRRWRSSRARPAHPPDPRASTASSPSRSAGPGGAARAPTPGGQHRQGGEPDLRRAPGVPRRLGVGERLPAEQRGRLLPGREVEILAGPADAPRRSSRGW